MTVYSSDHEVMATAFEWLEEGHSLCLVTVLKTWGSSPRPPGSLMIMRRDGLHTGSVSGGCVEEDLIHRFKNDEISATFPIRLNYGVDRQEATRFGLPCGGRLELLIEKLEDKSSLHQLLEAMERQAVVARRVDLSSGEVSLTRASPDLEFDYSDDAFVRAFGPRWQMLLIGAGHLSRCVSQLALMLDYRVIVCEPREEYSQSWNVGGTEMTTMMPDDAVAAYGGHDRSIVITLTHDPRLDDMALIDALNGGAFYVGAIGSKRNCEERRKRLLQMGLSSQQLQRLHAPVGLDIGSHTPPEIAVSILAQITAERNLKAGVSDAGKKVSAA